jgi:cytochrome c biogenesis protein
MRRQLRESAQKGMEIFAGNDEQAGFVAVRASWSAFRGRRAGKGGRHLHEDPERQPVGFVASGAPGRGLAEAGRRNEACPLPATCNQCATPMPSSTGHRSFCNLKEFEEIKASVLQVTRSPGKKVVYFGCLFLVLGVFCHAVHPRTRRSVDLGQTNRCRRACADGDEHPAPYHGL